MEILPAPTGLSSTGLPARRAHGNDTTCTTRSDYSGHGCRLHSAAACGESLPSPQESHAQSTARRKDALPHTYPGFSSSSAVLLLGIFIPPILLIITVHFALMLRAVPSHPSGWDSRLSTGLLWFSRHLSTFFLPQKKPIEKAAADFSRNGLAVLIFAILTISYFPTAYL